jgi:hypothetical protein
MPVVSKSAKNYFKPVFSSLRFHKSDLLPVFTKEILKTEGGFIVKQA